MVFHAKKIRGMILDMDGVLWRGSESIGELPEIFQTIQSLGYKVTLASNNATKSQEQFLEKLVSFGVNQIEKSQIINSTHVAGRFLKKQHPSGGAIYAVGEAGMIHTLSEYGFCHSENNDVCAVVVGLDREINYQKIDHASRLIRRGVPFIGTNPDQTYPTPDGFSPGAGAMIAAIETASGVPARIMGKPHPEIFYACLESMELMPEQVIAVGDRLSTDISCGQTAGCYTALVLSGITTLEEAEQWEPSIDWIGPDLASLLHDLAQMPNG